MRNGARWLLTVALILTPAFVLAQHGGHGGGSEPGGFGQSGPDRAMRDLQKAILIQGTEEQRAQYKQYAGFAAQVREGAEALAGADGPSISSAQARTHANQIREALAGMQQTHADFEAGLAELQRKAVGKQTKKMKSLSTDLTVRLQALDQELTREEPDGRAVAQRGKKLLEVIRNWQSEQQKVADKLGVSALI